MIYLEFHEQKRSQSAICIFLESIQKLVENILNIEQKQIALKRVGQLRLLNK